MPEWLGLDELIAISQLQTRGVQLDLERVVLYPHSPLQAALAAHVPFSSIGAETIVVYPPNQRGRASGFVQYRLRERRPETDFAFIAPSLDSARGDGVSIWYRLLAECTQRVGERGVQRLFAQMLSGNGSEEVFRQAGFTVYAHEDIYRLAERPRHLKKTHLLRHQRARDAWNLLRLYSELTPRPVQIAEGMLSQDGRGGKLRDWWEQSRGTGYIFQVDQEFAGAVRLLRGTRAYWMRVWLSPQAHEHADTLIHAALSQLWAAPRYPIYCSVREYVSGLRAPLEQAGFQFWLTRSLLVKHTTARLKEPAVKMVPGLEKRAEPATSIMRHS